MIRPTGFRFGGNKADQLFFQVCKDNTFCTKQIKLRQKHLRGGIELSKPVVGKSRLKIKPGGPTLKKIVNIYLILSYDVF